MSVSVQGGAGVILTPKKQNPRAKYYNGFSLSIMPPTKSGDIFLSIPPSFFFTDSNGNDVGGFACFASDDGAGNVVVDGACQYKDTVIYGGYTFRKQ